MGAMQSALLKLMAPPSHLTVDIRPRADNPRFVASLSMTHATNVKMDWWLESTMKCVCNQPMFHHLVRDGADVVLAGQTHATAQFRQDFASALSRCRLDGQPPREYSGFTHVDWTSPRVIKTVPRHVYLVDRESTKFLATAPVLGRTMVEHSEVKDDLKVKVDNVFASYDPRVFELRAGWDYYDIQKVFRCIASTPNPWGTKFDVEAQGPYVRLVVDHQNKPVEFSKAQRDAMVPVLKRCVETESMKEIAVCKGVERVEVYNPEGNWEYAKSVPEMTVLE